MEEINAQNLRYPGISLDNVTVTREQAEAVFKLLLSMGANKNIDMYLSDTGHVTLLDKFKYPGWGKDGEDSVERTGARMYTLGQFINTLIRFDRSQHARTKHLENKINGMHQALTSVKKELKGGDVKKVAKK